MGKKGAILKGALRRGRGSSSAWRKKKADRARDGVGEQIWRERTSSPAAMKEYFACKRKRAYPTELAATETANRRSGAKVINRPELYVYQCDFADHFHIAHRRPNKRNSRRNRATPDEGLSSGSAGGIR